MSDILKVSITQTAGARVQLDEVPAKNQPSYEKVCTLLGADEKTLTEANYKKLFNFDLQGKLIDSTLGLDERPMSIGDALLSAAMDIGGAEATNKNELQKAIFAIIKDPKFTDSKDIDLTKVADAKELVSLLEKADGTDADDIESDGVNNFYKTDKPIEQWRKELGINDVNGKQIIVTADIENEAKSIIARLESLNADDIEKINTMNTGTLTGDTKTQIESLQAIIKILKNIDNDWPLPKPVVTDNGQIATLFNSLTNLKILSGDFLKAKTIDVSATKVNSVASEAFLGSASKITLEDLRMFLSELPVYQQGYLSLTGKDEPVLNIVINSLNLKNLNETVSFYPGGNGLDSAVRGEPGLANFTTTNVGSLDDQLKGFSGDIYNKTPVPPAPPGGSAASINATDLIAQLKSYADVSGNDLLVEGEFYKLKLKTADGELTLKFKEADFSKYLSARFTAGIKKEEYQDALNDFLEMRIRLRNYKEKYKVIPLALNDVSEVFLSFTPTPAPPGEKKVAPPEPDTQAKEPE